MKMLVFEFIISLFFNIYAVRATYANNPFLSLGPIDLVSILKPGTQKPTITPGPTTIPIETNLLSTQPPFIENKNCPKPRGQFPADACNKFINCWDGVAIEQDCPGSLVFNPKGFCDYAINVDCRGKPIVTAPPPPVIVTLPYPESSSLPPSVTDSTTTLPSSTTLSTTTTTTSTTTSKPWVTSSTTEKMPVPTVGSLTTPLIQIMPAPPADPTLKKKCLKPRGQFPSASCKKYVNCWDDTVVEQDCPEGLLFSFKGYCDFAVKVDCGNRIIPENVNQIPSQVVSQISNQNVNQVENQNVIQVGSQNGNQVTNQNVNQVSNQNVNQVGNQVSNQVSNQIVNQVANQNVNQVIGQNVNQVTGQNVNQVANQNVNQVVNQIVIPSTNSECPMETGTFRNRTRCNAFYTCLYNKVVATYECPEGYYFNTKLGVCDFEFKVDCSSGASTGITEETPKPEYGSSKCLEEFGLIRDSENCSIYHNCVSFKVAVTYVCPEGFKFNDNIGVCDYAERVDCSKPLRSFQHQMVRPTLAPESMARINACIPGEVLRLNADCSLAARCREDKAELIQCPTGLAYDSVFDKCMSPHLARC